MSERLDFVRQGDTDSVSFVELCRRFEVSPRTGYTWRARWRAEGEAGLVDRSRRPQSSPNQTPAGIEDLVVAVRKEHPAWGGRKINRVLLNEGHDRVPAPSTITDILRRRRLLDGERQPRGYQRWERDEPNELWQMDFKGHFGLDDGTRCHAFGLLDDRSRYNLSLDACTDERTETVRSLLIKAFRINGIPNEMLCDNGSPWGNDRGQPWTPLGVWLLDMGIRVIHSRPFHPQTAGKEERFHRTLDLEVLATRPSWPDHHSVQAAFDAWRIIYNHKRPHDALGLDVPADHYRPSPRSYSETIAPVDYPDDYQVRMVSANAKISYGGRRLRVGKAFIGRHVGIRPTTTDGIITVHYRHQTIRTIDLTQAPTKP